LELINELYYDARPNKSQDGFNISYSQLEHIIVQLCKLTFMKMHYYHINLHKSKATMSLK